MSIEKLICLNCSGALPLPGDADGITCAYCQTSFLVHRHQGGAVSLKRLRESVEEIAHSTARIEEHSESTSASSNVLARKAQNETLRLENESLQKQLSRIWSQKDSAVKGGMVCGFIFGLFLAAAVGDRLAVVLVVLLPVAGAFLFPKMAGVDRSSTKEKEGVLLDRIRANSEIIKNNENLVRDIVL